MAILLKKWQFLSIKKMSTFWHFFLHQLAIFRRVRCVSEERVQNKKQQQKNCCSPLCRISKQRSRQWKQTQSRRLSHAAAAGYDSFIIFSSIISHLLLITQPFGFNTIDITKFSVHRAHTNTFIYNTLRMNTHATVPCKKKGKIWRFYNCWLFCHRKFR